MTTPDEPVQGRPEDGPSQGGANPFGPGAPAFRAPARPSLTQRVSPVTEHLHGYPKRALRPDLVAGLTVAALAIPSAMA